MSKTEKRYPINMSFNDLIRRTLNDAHAKVIVEKDKEIIVTQKNGKEVKIVLNKKLK